MSGFKPREYDNREFQVWLPKGGYRSFKSYEEAKNWSKIAFPTGTTAFLLEVNDSAKIIETLVSDQTGA